MKRLRRIIMNTLTAISLLLALATAGMWVRSAFKVDRVIYHSGYIQWMLTTARGGIVFTSTDFESVTDSVSPSRFSHLWDNLGVPLPFWSRLFPDGTGFELIQKGTTRTPKSSPSGRNVPPLVITITPPVRGIGVPIWSVLLLFLTLPAIVFYRRTRYSGPGHCPACGYDMRANPARCSECGHEMESAGDGGDERG